MTGTRLREEYLRWVRGALPALVLPFALIALVQAMVSATWWSDGPPPAGGVRYLFLSVAVAGVVIGRNVRTRDTATRPLAPAAIVSLSWQMLTFALAPVVIGAALVFMTRQVWDFYALLLVTLVGLWLLFPRFDQWAEWASPRVAESSPDRPAVPGDDEDGDLT